MKQDRIYIALVAGLFVLLVIGLIAQPKKVAWDHTYLKNSTSPFASKAVYESLGDIFPKQKISTVNIPPYEFAAERKKNPGEKVNYLIIDDNLSLGSGDTKSILQLAEEGNHIFIATSGLQSPLADTLGIYVGFQQFSSFEEINDTIRLNFKQESLYSSKGFSMRSGENSECIYIGDSVPDVEVLSVNSRGNPVYIKKKIGDGAVYVHSVPLAFTNFYMIYFNNYGYISRCLSFLPVAPVYWDEYFKLGRKESATNLRVILQNPALKTAYILALFLIAVFMLFQSKRRQRVIPVIKPFENSTLQFVGTVARLYYNKGDHTSLAKKKVIYLKEKLRIKYQIPIANNEETILAISARSGVDKETATALFKGMEYIERMKNINEPELVHFNKLTEEFWNKANK